MATKKKTPAATHAQKHRKTGQRQDAAPQAPTLEVPTTPPPAESAASEALPIEPPAPSDPTPSAEVADSPAAPQPPQPAQAGAKAPLPAGPAPAETLLRYWQVRRGPQAVGQTLAGSAAWALQYARQQFGDDVTVEPGRLAPGPNERPQHGRKPKDPGKRSALDAAALVLAEAGQPMSCPELIAAMAIKGYWSSPAGKTPAATLYSALLRETTTKGEQARFIKTQRGKFALHSGPAQTPAEEATR